MLRIFRSRFMAYFKFTCLAAVVCCLEILHDHDDEITSVAEYNVKYFMFQSNFTCLF